MLLVSRTKSRPEALQQQTQSEREGKKLRLNPSTRAFRDDEGRATERESKSGSRRSKNKSQRHTWTQVFAAEPEKEREASRHQCSVTQGKRGTRKQRDMNAE